MLNRTMHPYRSIGLRLLIVLVFAIALGAPQAFAEKRLLLVGDSWAQAMKIVNTFDAVFADEGHPQIQVVAGTTAIGGTSASQWRNNLWIIGNAIASNPTVDMVHLSVGGIDFLSRWRTSLSDQQEAAVIADIKGDVQAIVNYILARRSNIRVVICGYDYLNFSETLADPEVYSKWVLMGKPTARESNEAWIELGREKLDIAQKTGRCEYVQNWGLMQYFFGYPSLGAPPGVVAMPGAAPDYSPFPGGHPGYPSPPEALYVDSGYLDPIHLNEDGYYYLAWNCATQYYIPWLEGTTPPPEPPPAPAAAPSPGDDTTNVGRLPVLTWEAGAGTVEHKVYFGAGALTYRGTQAKAEYAPTELSYGKTYVWRIDEVNDAGVTEGPVWTFTVEDEPVAKEGCGITGPVDRNASLPPGMFAAFLPMLMGLAVVGLWLSRRHVLQKSD